eukprot:scaffold79539_cov54-Attheya_sp.AAC.3
MATTTAGAASGTILPPPKMADPIKAEMTTTTTTTMATATASNQEEHIVRTNKPPSLFKKRGGALRNKKKWKQASRSHGSSDSGGEDDDDDGPVKKEEDEKQKDDHDDGVEPSALESIRSIKQRRKIRNSLTASRGVDALSLLQGGTHSKQRRRRQNQMEAGNDDNNDDDDEANAPLRDRLYGSFAGGTGADAADGMGEGVMGKKHHEAMEAYIQKQMGHDSLSSTSASSNSHKNSHNKEDNTNVNDGDGPRMATTAQMEAQLYEELLATTTATSTSAMGSLQRGGEEEASGKMATAGTAAAEGDVGAGGAVLGGTGIAEVELPVEERIQNVKRTEQAAAARARQYHPHNRKRHVSENKHEYSETSHVVVEEMLPTNFGAGPSKRKKTQGSTGVRPVPTVGGVPSSSLLDQKQQEERGGASASSAGAEVLREDVSGLGASYSHNFKLHTHEWVHKRKEEREAELQAERVLQLANEGTATNRQRMGFDAARRVARGQIPLPTPHHTTEGSTGTRPTTTGAATATGGNATNNRDNSNFQRSNDDRVWKTFMARQRGRR